MSAQLSDEQLLEELLPVFKALADANRLKILGLLAQQELSVEQLAEMLHLRPSTVSHHLARLSDVGLVGARPHSYYNLYHMESGALEKMAQRLLARETMPAVAADVDIDAYDRKVLNTYLLPDGRLKDIPLQYKKLLVILRHILPVFEPGVRYPEKAVNEMLKRYHEDYASLRRDLIDEGMLRRENGIYWRPEE